MNKLSVGFLSGIGLALFVSFTQPGDLKASMERGKVVYQTYCASCHMMEGEGLEAVFPPMAKNPNLAMNEKMIQVTLKGMKGELTVNGKTYRTDMAPVLLSDQETADVLNYIRNSWGNKYPQIMTKEIQPALKVKVKDLIAY